jgi:hypothetical protein
VCVHVELLHDRLHESNMFDSCNPVQRGCPIQLVVYNGVVQPIVSCLPGLDGLDDVFLVELDKRDQQLTVSTSVAQLARSCPRDQEADKLVVLLREPRRVRTLHSLLTADVHIEVLNGQLGLTCTKNWRTINANRMVIFIPRFGKVSAENRLLLPPRKHGC